MTKKEVFVRSAEYEGRLVLEALEDKDIIKDAQIDIMWDAGRLRAWCNEANSYIQFPKALRKEYVQYISDIVQVKAGEKHSSFYRAMKGTIRLRGGKGTIVG